MTSTSLLDTHPKINWPTLPSVTDDDPQGLDLGEPLSNDPNLPWNPQLSPAFVVSIRKHRWEGLQARLKYWDKNVTLWLGTNGYEKPKDFFVQEGVVHHGSTLGQGQRGCIHSHVSIWRHIVKHGIPQALIMEDDCNFRYSEQTVEKLSSLFSTIAEKKISFDILYLAHRPGLKGENITENLYNPQKSQGTVAYVLTLEGAKKLLMHALPMSKAVDLSILSLTKTGVLKAVSSDPPLFWIVPIDSDTSPGFRHTFTSENYPILSAKMSPL